MLASIVTEVKDPAILPTDFQVEGRTGTIKVGDVMDNNFAPIKNPVTGDEETMRVAIPAGQNPATARGGSRTHLIQPRTRHGGAQARVGTGFVSCPRHFAVSKAVPPQPHRLATRNRAGALVLFVAALAVLISSPPALAGVADAGISSASGSSPLAGLPWGVYAGPIDGVWPAYQAAAGENRNLLARIALRPRFTWFGSWISDGGAEATARQYIATVTNGNPDVLTQIAIFRVDPWEAAACGHAPSAAQQASYRNWIDGFARGIGSSRVALVLQPDLPFALCAPSGGRLVLSLVRYAAHRFGALAHTTVYIDVGAADWPTVNQAVSLLRSAGVTYARGFALNDTHYDSNPSELQYGAKVSAGLVAVGLRGKHFVINTAENGDAWKYWQYHGNHANPRVCRSAHDRLCMTLGVPPTAGVTNRRWGLPPSVRRIAAKLCDAFLWIGRPWLYAGSSPFEESQALQLARSTPYR